MRKGFTEGTVGVAMGLLIALIVAYMLWRIYGGGEAAKTTAHIIAGMLGS